MTNENFREPDSSSHVRRATPAAVGAGPAGCRDDQTGLDRDRQFQEMAFELARLRSQLAIGEEQRDHLQAAFDAQAQNLQDRLRAERQALAELESKWAAVAGSRGFRFLQRLHAILRFMIPHGSRRERLASAAIGRLRPAGPIPPPVRKNADRTTAQSAPTIGPAPLPDTPASSPSDVPPAAVVLPRTETAPLPVVTAPDAPAETRELGWPWRIDLQAAPYFPLSWTVDKTSVSDSRFLNLIILSLQHRSGSTLLQRICNARKKTLIWGEHDAILIHFADIYRSLAGFSITKSAERNEFFASNEDPNLWTANMCPEVQHAQNAVVHAARTLLNTLYRRHRESHDIVGFKEVRYGRGELELLRQCYPEATFLFLVRHPVSTWNSTPRDWAPSFDVWIDSWRTHGRDFAMLAGAHPNCYLLRYEDLVQQDPRTMEILRDAARVSRDEIAGVLAHKLGSSHVGVSEQERATILDRCAESMELLGYQ